MSSNPSTCQPPNSRAQIAKLERANMEWWRRSSPAAAEDAPAGHSHAGCASGFQEKCAQDALAGQSRMPMERSYGSSVIEPQSLDGPCPNLEMCSRLQEDSHPAFDVLRALANQALRQHHHWPAEPPLGFTATITNACAITRFGDRRTPARRHNHRIAPLSPGRCPRPSEPSAYVTPGQSASPLPVEPECRKPRVSEQQVGRCPRSTLKLSPGAAWLRSMHKAASCL